MRRWERPVVTLLRVGLGLLFVAAAWPKLQDPEAFSVSISHYRLVGETLGRVIALVLPPVELLVGLGLILGVADAGASLLTAALMAIFTGAVGIALVRDLDISCGCFGTKAAQSIGLAKLIENLGLLLAAVVVWRGDRSWLSLGSLRGRPIPPGAAGAETGPAGTDRTGA